MWRPPLSIGAFFPPSKSWACWHQAKQTGKNHLSETSQMKTSAQLSNLWPACPCSTSWTHCSYFYHFHPRGFAEHIFRTSQDPWHNSSRETCLDPLLPPCLSFFFCCCDNNALTNATFFFWLSSTAHQGCKSQCCKLDGHSQTRGRERWGVPWLSPLFHIYSPASQLGNGASHSGCVFPFQSHVSRGSSPGWFHINLTGIY